MIDAINVFAWIFIILSVSVMTLFTVSIMKDDNNISVRLLESIPNFFERHRKTEKLVNIIYYTGLICFIIKAVIFLINISYKILKGLGLV